MNSMRTVKLKQGIHVDCCKQVVKQGFKYKVSPSGAMICAVCHAAGVKDVPTVKL